MKRHDDDANSISDTLLDGIKLVDLGHGMAPAIVTKFFSDLGARVTRIEPATGDPFYDVYPAYRFWHAKAVLAPETDLQQLLAEADVCVLGGESFPGLTAFADAETLAKNYPKLVILDISGHLHGVEDAGRPMTDLLAQARTGLCFEQYSDRPIAMAFEPANYGAALQSLCGTLAALFERTGSGLGQIVRSSLYEGAITWLGMYWGDFDRPPASAFVNPKDPFPLIFRCRDGVWLHIVLGTPGSKYKLYKALGIDDPQIDPSDSGMPDPARGKRNFYGDIDLLSAHFGQHDSASLLERLWSQGLPVEPIEQPGGIWNHEQVQRNRVIVRDADGASHVGTPIIAKSVQAQAAKLGRSGAGPLDGVRVIDFGAFVAGPLASVILSDLGADVVKVEPIGGEATRGVLRGYMVANRGKRGFSLNLKSERGQKIAQDLAAGADIVTTNFRPGVSARLGIDPQSLHGIRSDLIVLQSPGYGSEGPLADRPAFDLVMQAICGHEARAAGSGNDPFWNRTFMVDFTGGMLGAIGCLSALLYRARSGNGVDLEAPLLNAGLFLFSELVQRPDGSWIGADAINSTCTGYRPSEALYQVRDGWIAIVARTSEQASALSDALGLNLPGDVHGWGPIEQAMIADAVARDSANELAARLEAVGVWTELCRENVEADTLNSASFYERGNLRVTTHHDFGRIRELGPLFTLSRSRLGSTRPIHAIGEHTRDLLGELGYADPEADELFSSSVVA